MNNDMIQKHNNLMIMISNLEKQAIENLNGLNLKHKYQDNITQMRCVNLSTGGGGILMYFQVYIDDDIQNTSSWKTIQMEMQVYDKNSFKTDPKNIEDICIHYECLRRLVERSKKEIKAKYLNCNVTYSHSTNPYYISDIDFYNGIKIELTNSYGRIILRSLKELEICDYR